MQSEMQKPSDKLKMARHAFSTVGISALLLLLLQIAMRLWLEPCLHALFPHFPDAWLLPARYLLLFAVAYPLSALPCRHLATLSLKNGSISARHFFAFLPILCLLGWCGSYLGNIFGALLSDLFGLQMTNSLGALADENPLVVFVITVLLAPIAEECFFRKLFLDRIRTFGEKLAILVSALVFALAHANIYQFFYAFFIGLVFGYVYLHTGKVWVTALLHAIYNLYYGFLSMQLLNLPGVTAFVEAETVEAQFAAIAAYPLDMVLLSVFGMLNLALLIVGGVLLFKYRKKVYSMHALYQLPPDTEGAAAGGNIGMLLYVLVAVFAAFYFGSRA